MNSDQRQFAPACARNRDPILTVLKQHFPPNPSTVLEIAAGTGEHAVHFAPHFPSARWHPTDANPAALTSIQAWATHSQVENIEPPAVLDVCMNPWPITQIDALLAINMIHISPWSCTEGLMAGAGRHLTPGGILFLYGPYKRDGAHTAQSNADFDSWLKSQTTDWGVRDLEAVSQKAGENGLTLRQAVPMPSNNFSVIFARN